MNIIIIIALVVSLLFILKIKKYYFIQIYLSSILLYVCIIVFILTIIINPKQSINAALSGLYLWINAVFPSLFPFFVSTELLINLGFVHIIGTLLEPIMRPLFNVPGSGSFAFALGIISGYPVGAKTTVNLYQNKLCAKTESERLLAFCNNAGPLFILGSIAVGMFNYSSVGPLLFLSHLLASVSVGAIFRFFKFENKKENKCIENLYSENIIKKILKQIKSSRRKDGRNFGEMLGDAIKNAINLLLTIAGFIVFFSVFIKLLEYLKITPFLSEIIGTILIPFGIPKELAPSIASGFFEITTGIKMASSQISVPLAHKLITTSLILGWGGLSVHCQVISIASQTDISILPYLTGKGIQGILSAFYTYLLLSVFQWSIPTSINFSIVPTDKIEYPSMLFFFYHSTLNLANILLFISLCCIILASISAFSHKKNI